MSGKKLKAKDKITQKMSRDGLVERNEASGVDNLISNREAEIDLRSGAPDSQDLPQITSPPNGRHGGEGDANSPGNRTKAKQRQIETFLEKEYGGSGSTAQGSEPITATSGTASGSEADVNKHEQQDSAIRHTSDNAMPSTGTQSQGIMSDVPQNVPAEPHGTPSDAPGRDSLSQFGTSSSGKPETRQKAALCQDKPSALRHGADADMSAEMREPQESLKTRRDGALQLDELAGTANNAESENQPHSDSEEYAEAPPENSAPNQTQTGEGKRCVQGNTAYRQKTLEASLAGTITPVTPAITIASETAKPDENKPDSPPPDAPDTDVPASPIRDSNKPGRLQFSDNEAAPDNHGDKPDRKLQKAERQAERANDKLDKAKSELPTKKRLRSERVFDEETGKGSQKLHFEKEIKPQGEHMKGSLPLRPVKMAANAGIAKLHSKMYQVEHENVEIKAAHRTEMAAEGGVRSSLSFRKTSKYKKVAKLERQAAKKSVNLSYRKAVAGNPKLKSNALSRMWQKRKIRKDYAKKARNTKKAAGMAKKSVSATVNAAKLLVKAAFKNPKVLIIAAVIGLIILILMSLFSLATSIGGGGMSAVLAATYLSETDDIEAAAIAYSEWQTDLRFAVIDVENSHPGFDEYRVNMGNIRHCPVELMAFLTAVHHEFTFSGIESDLRTLFDKQYTLTFTPSIEIRFAPPIEPGGAPVPYEWHVMTVTLAALPFTDVLMSNMTPEQQAHFAVLMETKGNRQIVGSPFDFYWFPSVSSHYGWRIHPISGERNMHRGIDIAQPTGTPIRAAHGGTVTVAQYLGAYGNVVFLVGADGIETRYAHADTLLVIVGDTVAMGDIIATVGSTGSSTGPHLHFEVLVNGSYVNPAFFAHTGG
jgi:hypothetical protein